jgi:hypothetical protein
MNDQSHSPPIPPLFTSAPTAILRSVQVLASDIDDTLTIDGTFSSGVIARIEQLADAGIALMLVTGRAAGWAQALANYLPGLSGVISENGMIAHFPGEPPRRLVHADAALEQALAENLERLRLKFDLPVTEDGSFRLLDRSLIRPPGFSAEQIAQCHELVDDAFEVIASSIQIHVKPKQGSKATALRTMLEELHPGLPLDQVLTVGDSANDAPLFRHFPLSVGVANVLDYRQELQDAMPRYIAQKREGRGFIEIVDHLLQIRV